MVLKGSAAGCEMCLPTCLLVNHTSHCCLLRAAACVLQAALKSAALIVERLLDREKVNNGGKYPESIALVLWGTDNIKTYGEAAHTGQGCTCSRVTARVMSHVWCCRAVLSWAVAVVFRQCTCVMQPCCCNVQQSCFSLEA
jgi:hypothetical protein